MTSRRNIYIAAGAILVAFVCGYIAHRPADVQTQHTVTVAARETISQDVDARKDEHVHTVVVTERKPDGTTTQTLTRDAVSSSGADIKNRVSEVVQSEEKESYRTKSAPGYRLRLDTGWDPRRPDLRPRELTAGVDRRLFGGLWVGLWVRQELGGTPLTATGLSLSIEF